MIVLHVDAGLAGMAAVNEDGEFRWRKPLGSGHSALDELAAIDLAMEWLSEDGETDALILCDNVSAVKSIYDVGRVPKTVVQAAANIRALCAKNDWRVAWIPRQANRAADIAARRGEYRVV